MGTDRIYWFQCERAKQVSSRFEVGLASQSECGSWLVAVHVLIVVYSIWKGISLGFSTGCASYVFSFSFYC